MRGKLASLLAIVSALAIVASACTDDVPTPPLAGTLSAATICRDDPFGCVRVEERKPIRLGALMVFGEADPRGEAAFATRLAVQLRGPILGHAIKPVIRNDSCGIDYGSHPVVSFSSDSRMAAVVGGGCVSHTQSFAELLSESGMLFVSARGTGPAFTDPQTRAPFSLRTVYNDIIQASAMAGFVRDKLGLRRVATVHDGSPFAESLAAQFEDEVSRLGGRITAREAISVGETDFGLELDRTRRADPDFFYAPIFLSEGALLAEQLRALDGPEGTVFGGSDALFTPDWLELAGPAVEGAYITRPGWTREVTGTAQGFLERLESRFGKIHMGWIQSVLAPTFDASNLVLDAIEDVAFEEDGTLYISRTALRDRMLATKDYPGLSGTLTCDVNGDCNHSTPVIIYQVRNGAFRKAWTWDPTA